MKDGYGITPLALALFMGRKDLALELVKNNADVNCVDHAGQSALHLAAGMLPTMVGELLDKGADPLAQNVGGFEPIFYAANGYVMYQLALAMDARRQH